MKTYQYKQIAPQAFAPAQVSKLKKLAAAVLMLNHFKEVFKPVPVTVVNRLIAKKQTTNFKYICPVYDTEDKETKYLLTNRPVYQGASSA